MSSISVVSPTSPIHSSRLALESQVDMQNVSASAKATRVSGQSQDNVVNIATTTLGKNQANTNDDRYSHQHHIAFNAYRGFDKQAAPETATGLTDGSIGMPKDSAKGNDAAAKLLPQNPILDKADSKDGKEDNKSISEQNAPKDPKGEPLSEEDQQKLKELQARDAEVRTHERAHQSAGGRYASAPSYEYEKGPDGKSYATSGEVNIDVSEEKDPQATIDKMQVVKRAALAPAEPSAQDRRVYSEASQKESRARQELAKKKKAEQAEATGAGSAAATTPAQSTNDKPQVSPREQTQGVIAQGRSAPQAQNANALKPENESKPKSNSQIAEQQPKRGGGIEVPKSLSGA